MRISAIVALTGNRKKRLGESIFCPWLGPGQPLSRWAQHNIWQLEVQASYFSTTGTLSGPEWPPHIRCKSLGSVTGDTSRLVRNWHGFLYNVFFSMYIISFSAPQFHGEQGFGKFWTNARSSRLHAVSQAKVCWMDNVWNPMRWLTFISIHLLPRLCLFFVKFLVDLS